MSNNILEYNIRRATFKPTNSNVAWEIIINCSVFSPILIFGNNLIDEHSVMSAKVIGPSKNSNNITSNSGQLLSNINKEITIPEIIYLKDDNYQKENQKERYVYLGTACRPDTFNKLSFYYDRKCKDIFGIPIDSFLHTNNNGFIFNPHPKANRLQINGFMIGHFGSNFGQGSDGLLEQQTLSNSYIKELSEPNPKNIIINTYCIVLPNAARDTGKRLGSLVKSSNSNYYFATKNEPLAFVSFGRPSDIFGKTLSLPRVLVHKVSPNKWTLQPIGMVESDHLFGCFINF